MAGAAETFNFVGHVDAVEGAEEAVGDDDEAAGDFVDAGVFEVGSADAAVEGDAVADGDFDVGEAGPGGADEVAFFVEGGGRGADLGGLLEAVEVVEEAVDVVGVDVEIAVDVGDAVFVEEVVSDEGDALIGREGEGDGGVSLLGPLASGEVGGGGGELGETLRHHGEGTFAEAAGEEVVRQKTQRRGAVCRNVGGGGADNHEEESNHSPQEGSPDRMRRLYRLWCGLPSLHPCQRVLT